VNGPARTSPEEDGSASTRLGRALARLDALVNWERRDRDASMRRGLAPASDLLRLLGAPERRWRAVHVAGTKGKGTTSSLVAAGLRRAGLRVGLYTSPHANRIQERVRIDGVDVDDERLAAALERALAAREAGLVAGSAAGEATWFDLVTAAAFLVFAEADVEWAVVECGLGGRLDSTNVVAGEVCVVTNVELEHTAVLGTTRAAIAREKGGIVKRGTTLVTSCAPEDEAGAVLAEIARGLDVPVVRPESIAGTMLERNAEVARLVLDELGRRGVGGSDGRPLARSLLDATTIESARLPARAERLTVEGVPVVIDAAHVPGSVRLLLDELEGDPTLRGRATAVLALGRDKDAAGILKALAGRVDRVLCTTTASGPLAGAESLQAEALRAGLCAETASDPSRALALALDLARAGGWVLVIGSFYLAGAVRASIDQRRSGHPGITRC
jgi:dihydrofolate synthase/folylpolyglutamate synthase